MKYVVHPLSSRIQSTLMFESLAVFSYRVKMAPRRHAILSVLTGIISSIAAFIQLNIAVLNYQADYERKRVVLVQFFQCQMPEM